MYEVILKNAISTMAYVVVSVKQKQYREHDFLRAVADRVSLFESD